MHTDVYIQVKKPVYHQLNNENSLCSLPRHCACIFWSSHFICKQSDCFPEKGER